MIAALLAAAALAEAPAATAPAAAPTAVSGVTVSAQAKPKPKDELVCELDTPIGSKLKRQVCLPRSYVEARTRAAQVQVDRMTSGGPVPFPTGGNGH